MLWQLNLVSMKMGEDQFGNIVMENTFSDLQPYPMTVVIATLGGYSLKGTIEALNLGTIVPDEILICIPTNEAPRVQNLSFRNVKVLVTDCRGQVAQRAVGFRNASHDVVMQLDDDMLVDEHCIEHLLKTLKTCGTKVAVAPSLISLSTGESAYRKPQRNKIVQKVYYWFMNGSDGYQPGRIDRSGSAIGIDPKSENRELFDVEWLAGGCVMHYRENLILENFYPLEGKAYCEDVIHSYYLKSRGINLIVDSGALCRLELVFSSSYGLRDFLNNLASDYRARKYFMRLSSRRCFRMYLFYIASCLSYVSKKTLRLRVFRKNMEFPLTLL